jgi:hypothetical protein
MYSRPTAAASLTQHRLPADVTPDPGRGNPGREQQQARPGLRGPDAGAERILCGPPRCQEPLPRQGLRDRAQLLLELLDALVHRGLAEMECAYPRWHANSSKVQYRACWAILGCAGAATTCRDSAASPGIRSSGLPPSVGRRRTRLTRGSYRETAPACFASADSNGPVNPTRACSRRTRHRSRPAVRSRRSAKSGPISSPCGSGYAPCPRSDPARSAKQWRPLVPRPRPRATAGGTAAVRRHRQPATVPEIRPVAVSSSARRSSAPRQMQPCR